MDFGLNGRTAVVCGSTSGLGLAIARVLAHEGANVVVSGRRRDAAEREAAQLPSALGVEVDLSDVDGPAHLVSRARDHFGAVDIMVLNAGGPPPGPAAKLTPDSTTPALQTLLLAQIHLVSLVLPEMRDRRWGRVIAVGSSGVQQPLPNLALSNVARAGLAAYLKTLAAEVAGDGVTVNVVLPGRIDTDRVAALDAADASREGVDSAEARRRSETAIPAGRYGRPEEFAAVVAFLCSAAASYVTGEQVRCDGGLVRSF
jgi:3-oxoacyl-[acyl-carrier protein] reductase